jgi:hypothetical protein
VYGNAGDFLIGGLSLSNVQAHPDRDAQLPDCRDDRLGCTNRLGRLVEGGEEPVSSGIDLSTMEPMELSANRSVVRRHKSLPRPIPEADGQVRRPDDIREEDCR